METLERFRSSGRENVGSNLVEFPRGYLVSTTVRGEDMNAYSVSHVQSSEQAPSRGSISMKAGSETEAYLSVRAWGFGSCFLHHVFATNV